MEINYELLDALKSFKKVGKESYIMEYKGGLIRYINVGERDPIFEPVRRKLYELQKLMHPNYISMSDYYECQYQAGLKYFKGGR